MSDDIAMAAPAVEPKLDPESLVLRARPSRAIRFKRGLIVALAACAAALLAAIAWFAFAQTVPRAAPGLEQSAPLANQAPGDALARLPANYGSVPKLGPPLPGDLGKPLLDHGHELLGQAAVPAQPAPADDARSRALEAQKAARESALIAGTGGHGASADPAGAPVSPAVADEGRPAMAPDAAGDPDAQARKMAFVEARDTGPLVNPHALQPPASPNLLAAGSVIAASLISGIRSDLPGLVTAQVTENVYDSATGHVLLLPQGSRLIGSYDSVVAFGQKRALIVWQRIVLPDASSLRLDNVPATDPSGYGGLADRVDFHTWSLLRGIVLSTLLGVGPELALSGEGDLVQAIRLSTQGNVSRAGDQLTSRNLQVQPTITIRPGARVLLVVHRDLILKPWHA